MHEGHHARVTCGVEYIDHRAALFSEVNSRQEDLVTRLASRSQFRHERSKFRRWRPARCVEKDVANRKLRNFGQPSVHRLDDVLAVLGVRKCADGCDPAREGGRRPGREIVDKAALQVRMRVNPARHHEVATGFDHSRVRARG